MKSIKKDLTIFGAVAIAFLIVSSVTAVSKINSDASKDIIRLELEPTINECVDLDIDEIVEYMNVFIESFTSDEFIDYMKSDVVMDFVESDWALNFYNLPEVQDYVSSDEFMDLYNTNEAQYFLEQILDNYDETIAKILMLVGLIIGVMLWIPAGIVILGLAVGFTAVQILDYLQNLEEDYTSLAEKFQDALEEFLGYFIELYPLLEDIASLLSSTAAIFFVAITGVALLIETLITIKDAIELVTIISTRSDTAEYLRTFNF